jgi:hypothetical protein
LRFYEVDFRLGMPVGSGIRLGGFGRQSILDFIIGNLKAEKKRV